MKSQHKKSKIGKIFRLCHYGAGHAFISVIQMIVKLTGYLFLKAINHDTYRTSESTSNHLLLLPIWLSIFRGICTQLSKQCTLHTTQTKDNKTTPYICNT